MSVRGYFLWLFFVPAIFLSTACSEEDDTKPTAITAIVPSRGAEGMRIKVQGTSFGESISDHAITFNGEPAIIEEVTDEQITVIVPKDVATGPVTLTLRGTAYEGPLFTVLEDEFVDLASGFSMDAGIATIGSAFVYESQTQEGLTTLRLTPPRLLRVGIGYYGVKVPVIAGFETTFDFQIHEIGAPDGQTGERGSEGFAFIIQNQDINARGHLGASMGYAGIRNSLAIEFDVYQNVQEQAAFQDPNGNHISIQTNLDPDEQHGETGAEIYHSLAHTTDQTHPDLPNLITQGAEKHAARIVYTPGELSVYLNNKLILSKELNLSDYVNTENGKAYVGFAASTSFETGWASHDILNWSFNPQ